MADSYVCSGAMMKCTMGTSPAKLTVLPIRTVFLTGQPMANISDHQSMVNLAPFGLCRSLGFPPTAAATAAAHGHLTPMPCMHNTPALWMGGKMDYLVKGQPALLKSCKCQCMWGGTISLVTDGQIGEGTQYVQKKKKTDYSFGDFEFGAAENTQPSAETQSADVPTIRKATITDVRNTEAWVHTLSDEQKSAVKDVMRLIPGETDVNKLVKVAKMVLDCPKSFSFEDKMTAVKNNVELENRLNIQKGDKMSIAQADKQNANPNHSYEYIVASDGELYYYEGKVYLESDLPQEAVAIKDSLTRCKRNPNYKREYSINCATCSAAYALRLMGFDVKAKGNVAGSLNNDVSYHPFDMWNNVDGTKAEQVRTKKWMKDNNIESMTIEDYKKFFDETCAEEGVYTIALQWKGEGGHATVLQRDKDGKLYYIEPQVYNSGKTQDGRRSIDDLLISSDGNLKLTSNPSGEEGILRVDDKLLNPEYASLFEI